MITIFKGFSWCIFHVGFELAKETEECINDCGQLCLAYSYMLNKLFYMHKYRLVLVYNTKVVEVSN